MVYVIGPDPLLTCPLDESHRILKSRMQFHLVRCLKNHKLGNHVKCPWNPLHIVDKFAYEDHYKRECEDMPGALEFICQTEEARDVGSVPVTATNAVMPPGNEDWDADPGNVGTYDPTKNAEGKLVLRCAIGLSKAKKKEWRQAERRRFQMLEDNGPTQIKSQLAEMSIPKPLRPPRKIGLAMSADTSMIDDLNASRLSEDDRRSVKSRPNALLEGYRADTPSRASMSVASDVESQAGDEIPNLRQMFSSSIEDVASRRSSVSSRSKIEALSLALARNLRVSNGNNSAHCLSEAENSLLDEAVGIPKLVAPVAKSDDETVRVLSQRFEELTTEQKKIEESRVLLMQKILQYDPLPKLVSSNASHASLNLYDGQSNAPVSGNEDAASDVQSNVFLKAINRCAANFPKHPKDTSPPTNGVGRGIVKVHDSSKVINPGQRSKDIPFDEADSAYGNAGDEKN